MSKWTYNPAESVNVDGKNFHMTPPRKEFLEILKSKYPNQLQFTKEQFDAVGEFPYWLKNQTDTISKMVLFSIFHQYLQLIIMAQLLLFLNLHL